MKRERLTLASLKGAAVAAPTPAPAPAPAPDPAPAAPVKPPATAVRRRPNPEIIREFTFPDGRPITLHRDTVRFAAPLKTDPEHATLVASKDGASAMPLMVQYRDFCAWWRGFSS